MTPQAAFDQQIDRYRNMSGEERLTIALNLHELACEVTREGIRRQHPEADEAEVERLLHDRIELARSLERVVCVVIPSRADGEGPRARGTLVRKHWSVIRRARGR